MVAAYPLAYPLVPVLPAAMQVEVTAACNLRCTMCLVRYRPPVNRIAGAMPLPLFSRLVEEVPTLRELTMQGLGEPLLSPHLLDMVALAHARGIRVGFNSNATLLTRRMADRLVAAGLDWLHVSLDGADAATYEAIRDGATFSRVVANLAGLVAAKRAAGSAVPWIRVVFVAMRRNVAQLPPLVELLGGIGVRELRVQNLSHSFSDTDPSGAYREIREHAAAEALWTGQDRAVAERAFAEARRRADANGLVLRLPLVQASRAGAPAAGLADRPGCTWPWDATYVTSGGVVQPCCMVMGDDRIALGDLNRESFPAIWAGALYQEFRRRLRQPGADGAGIPAVCSGCSLYHRTF
jgi:MoaA/NifB/PqqE/SkfB family radical SAM enzyme